MRVELPDGQWVDLREELTHGQFKRLMRAQIRRETEPEAGPDVLTEFVAVYASAWLVRAPDGSNIDLPADLDARLAIIDAMPATVVATVADKAIDIWRGRPDPNASAAS